MMVQNESSLRAVEHIVWNDAPSTESNLRSKMAVKELQYVILLEFLQGIENNHLVLYFQELIQY